MIQLYTHTDSSIVHNVLLFCGFLRGSVLPKTNLSGFISRVKRSWMGFAPVSKDGNPCLLSKNSGRLSTIVQICILVVMNCHGRESS